MMLAFLLFVCLIIACLYAVAEIVYERDFPRHFCKYILLFGALLLCAVSGVAQGIRYDSNITTSSTNVPVGAQAPLYTYPNSLVTVCAYPATPTTGAVCTNTITTYINQALTSANPTTLTSDFQGKFGFWLAQGTYTYSVVTPSNRYLGTYIISLGGAGAGSGTVTSVSGVNANGLTVSVANPTTTPAVTVGIDGTHVLPTNTGSASTYLNGAGAYTTPSAGGLTSFQGRSTPAASLTTADVTGLGTLTNNTTGNAATAAALNHTPTLCGTGFAPTGIDATGAAVACAALGGSAPTYTIGVTPLNPNGSNQSIVFSPAAGFPIFTMYGAGAGGGLTSGYIDFQANVFQWGAFVIHPDNINPTRVLSVGASGSEPSFSVSSGLSPAFSLCADVTGACADSWNFTYGSSGTNFGHIGSSGALFTNGWTLGTLKLSNVTGSTQCLQADSAGNVTGSGANCPSSAHSDVAFIPSSASTPTATMLGNVFLEPIFVQFKTIIVRLTNTTCTVAPSVAFVDLGTSASTTYAGRSGNVTTLTTGTSDGVYQFTGTTNMVAGHYYGFAVPGGTCTQWPQFDITAQVQ